MYLIVTCLLFASANASLSRMISIAKYGRVWSTQTSILRLALHINCARPSTTLSLPCTISVLVIPFASVIHIRESLGYNMHYVGRRGDFVTCRYGQVAGISYNGGYADHMIAPTEALAFIPDELSATEAAPMMCAGVTTYNALRNSGARVGDVVAILGIGGLGHLGIQFAAKMGFKTIAIARGKDKEELSKKARC